MPMIYSTCKGLSSTRHILHLTPILSPFMLFELIFEWFWSLNFQSVMLTGYVRMDGYRCFYGFICCVYHLVFLFSLVRCYAVSNFLRLLQFLLGNAVWLISLELFDSRPIYLHLLDLVCVVYITFVVVLCYVLFSGLSWNLVQNTWIKPENKSRVIWSFLEFNVDPERWRSSKAFRSIDYLYSQ